MVDGLGGVAAQDGHVGPVRVATGEGQDGTAGLLVGVRWPAATGTRRPGGRSSTRGGTRPPDRPRPGGLRWTPPGRVRRPVARRPRGTARSCPSRPGGPVGRTRHGDRVRSLLSRRTPHGNPTGHPAVGGTLRTMQTQWSTGANDGHRSDGVGGGPTSAGPKVADVVVAGEATGEVTPTPLRRPMSPRPMSPRTMSSRPPWASRRPAVPGATTSSARLRPTEPRVRRRPIAQRSTRSTASSTRWSSPWPASMTGPTAGARSAGRRSTTPAWPSRRSSARAGACVIGGPGVGATVTRPPGVLDVPRATVAPVGLPAATGHHGG